MRQRTVSSVLAVVALVCADGCNSGRVSREQALSWAASQESWQRLGAACEFAESGDPEALAQLRSMARDLDPDVKGTALKALGVWRDELAVTVLVDAVTDDGIWEDCEKRAGRHVLLRRHLSETAHKSLVQISGYKLDFDPEANLDQRKAVQEEWRQRLAEYLTSRRSDRQ